MQTLHDIDLTSPSVYYIVEKMVCKKIKMTLFGPLWNRQFSPFLHLFRQKSKQLTGYSTTKTIVAALLLHIFVPISQNCLCGLNQSLVAMAANSLILISTETMAIMQNVVVMHQSWRGTRSSFCYFLLVWLNLITQTQKLCICHVHVCQRYGHFLSSNTIQCFYFYFPGTRLHSWHHSLSNFPRI